MSSTFTCVYVCRVCALLLCPPQVVVRVRPMFDVEEARGEQYAVQTWSDDPRHIQVLGFRVWGQV